MEEYTITEIFLPSATGCEHIHVHLSDESIYQYHITDFMGVKVQSNDPIYNFLYEEVQRLGMRKRSNIKKEFEGIKIYK